MSRLGLDSILRANTFFFYFLVGIVPPIVIVDMVTGTYKFLNRWLSKLSRRICNGGKYDKMKYITLDLLMQVLNLRRFSPMWMTYEFLFMECLDKSRLSKTDYYTSFNETRLSEPMLR